MAQVASKSCDICVSGTGRNFCQQCNQLFCDRCKISHLRTQISKAHSFVNTSNLNLEDKSFCSEHDKRFIFYCLDCNISVCQVCAVKKHNKHNMSDMKESVGNFKEQLIKSVYLKVKTLGNDIQQLEQGTRGYRSDVKTVIQSITEDANNKKLLIDRKAKELIKTLRTQEEKNLQNFSASNTELKETLSKVNKIQKAIRETANMSEVELLPKLNSLRSDLDKMETKKVPAMPEVKYSPKNIQENDILLGFLSSRKKTKHADGKPADGEPADGKPTDGEPADDKPADGGGDRN